MLPKNSWYLRLEVGGIQTFLFATGKLKEMIGASECVNAVTDSLYDDVCKRLDFTKAQTPQEATGKWVWAQQCNAGVLALVVPNEQAAKAFLHTFSRLALEQYPGLPLFGTVCAIGADGLQNARQTASKDIAKQRATRPVPCGMPMLPFVEAAPLDGLPAVGLDKTEQDTERNAFISLPSATRRNKNLLEQAGRRLKDAHDDVVLAALPEHVAGAVQVQWCDNLDEMLAGEERKRLALVHMDGNDLGALFQDMLATGQERWKEIKQFSQGLEAANTAAFKAGLQAVVKADVAFWRKTGKPLAKEYRVPLRPLVMGGDDITVLVRADLALAFITAFTTMFEKQTVLPGKAISLGVGMVVMPSSYPFAKAYGLVEELLKSAKKKTMGVTPRRSSLDYLVLTSDVDESLAAYRKRTAVAADGKALTCKPFELHGNEFEAFQKKALDVLNRLPRSQIRGAAELCRDGEKATRKHYENLLENCARALGGRKGEKQMNEDEFTEIFPEKLGYFSALGGNACPLADYLEYAHLTREVSHA